MPSASTTTPTHRPTDLVSRIASSDPDTQLMALREVKNQIIGNRTKKLSFLKQGVIPVVASILSTVLAQADSQLTGDDVGIALRNSDDNFSNNILVQAAAVLGSFGCGFDVGVRAVLDAGAFSNLIRLLSNSNEKVVDAGARALRMIYQSKLTPKYEFLEERNMEFLLSLLNSESETVTGLGASIIMHSCETSADQKALCDAGVLKKLFSLLKGSLNQRDASLEALASVFKNNQEVISQIVGPENERALGSIVELINDRYPRTRLLACMCLIVIGNASPCCLQDRGIRSKLVYLLLELLDDTCQVGDEAAFVFSSLIAEEEDLQKLAFEANAIDKLCNHLQKGQLHSKRLQGILLALADMCSKLESCRSRFLSLQALNLVTDALSHDSADVCFAACICLRSVTRSIKNLCAGNFMNEKLVIPLVQLLDDPSVSVQVAALGAISNIVVDFTRGKSAFMQCGGVKQLVHLSMSMDSTVRSNALWALKNMLFLADDRCKEGIFSELTAPLLAILICDPESSVKEQALAIVRNLVDGSLSSVEYAFAEDGLILDVVVKQLQSATTAEIGIQGMFVLGNVASGNEFHKEAVLRQLLSELGNGTQSFMINFLQSNDSRLRTAAIWVIVNLTFPSCPGSYGRVSKLRNAGILSQIRNMVNDSSLDVKLHAKTVMRIDLHQTVLSQSLTFADGLT